MKKILLAAIIIVLAATSAFFASRWRSAESRQQQTVAYLHGVMDSLETAVTLPPPPMFAERDSLYFKWVAINAQMNLERARNSMQKDAMIKQRLMDVYDIAELKKEGLTDPPVQLRASLATRPDLIPYAPVLGGTMSFDEPLTVLLNPPYAFATFEDGHIEGKMLLSYEVTDGKITWKRLWAELR
jgi:hypothetical protein